MHLKVPCVFCETLVCRLYNLLCIITMLLFLVFPCPSVHIKVTLSEAFMKVAVDVNIVPDTFVRFIVKPTNVRLSPGDDEGMKAGLKSLLPFIHLRVPVSIKHVSVIVSPGQTSSGSCIRVTTCIKMYM